MCFIAQFSQGIPIPIRHPSVLLPAPTKVKQFQSFSKPEITANGLPMKYVNSSQPQPEEFSETKNSLSTGLINPLHTYR